VISVGLDLFDEAYHEYIIRDRETGDQILLGGNAEESFTTHLDTGSDRIVVMTLDALGAVTYVNLVYGIQRRSLTYQTWEDEGTSHASLTWNLYDVAGWDRAAIWACANDAIYQGETRMLETFSVEVAPEENYPFANARYEFEPGALTAGLVDLSDFGLLFTEITAQRLLTDLDNLSADRLAVMALYGFGPDVAVNRNLVFAMVPFRADPGLIDTLFALMGSTAE